MSDMTGMWGDDGIDDNCQCGSEAINDHGLCDDCSNEEISQLRATVKTQADDLAVLAGGVNVVKGCRTCLSNTNGRLGAACMTCEYGHGLRTDKYAPSPAVALAIKYREK